MRLTCPNCGAQYEVPEDVIPPEGRDVQCSNCGDTWYQLSAEALAAEQEQASQEAETPVDTAASERPKRAIDPQVSQILREEAERESALRSAPGGSLETQTEMGLEDAFDPKGDGKSPPDPEPVEEMPAAESAPVAEEAPEEPEVVAEPAAEPAAEPIEEPAPATETEPTKEPEEPSGAVQVADPAEHAAVAAAVQGLMQSEEKAGKATPEKSTSRTRRSASRRDLLPDIEDVTQDLSDEDAPVYSRSPEALATAPKRSSGFRSGFVLMLLVMGVAMFVYAQAPEIAGVLPQADEALTTYVTWVDGLRLWLDDIVRGLSTEA